MFKVGLPTYAAAHVPELLGLVKAYYELDGIAPVRSHDFKKGQRGYPREYMVINVAGGRLRSHTRRAKCFYRKISVPPRLERSW